MALVLPAVRQCWRVLKRLSSVQGPGPPLLDPDAACIRPAVLPLCRVRPPAWKSQNPSHSRHSNSSTGLACCIDSCGRQKRGEVVFTHQEKQS